MSVNKDPYQDLYGEEITGSKEVKVWSIGAGTTAYALEDPKVNRAWIPGELKLITFHELYSLTNHPGGRYLLENNLQIKDRAVRDALGLPNEPEYLYTEEDAKRLVLSGDKDAILDALEFGPVGLASMIKHAAVVETKDVDMVEFFNKLFSMNIQETRAAQREESSAKPEVKAERRKQSEPQQKQNKTVQRKSAPLTPSEQKQQKPSQE